MPSLLIPRSVYPFRDLVWPKEHGSWSLAFEPLALGLIAAPSVAGVWFSLAVAAAFFGRRPLRIALRDAQARRRSDAWTAFAGCSVLATLFFLGALLSGGWTWLGWLLPSVAAGVAFLSFDLRGSGREELAEVAGAAAFAFFPAALVALAGWDVATSAALGVIMVGRAVPTVLCVRAYLRGTKTGVWRIWPALLGALVALGLGVALVRVELAPLAVAGWFVLFAGRAFWLLSFPRPVLRARTIGMGEAIFGIAFVVTVALAAGR